jgi:hypothetical protein
MASAQWSNVDTLLNIKMLGFANRRRDLMSEATIYFDEEKAGQPESDQPLEEAVSQPRSNAGTLLPSEHRH